MSQCNRRPIVVWFTLPGRGGRPARGGSGRATVVLGSMPRFASDLRGKVDRSAILRSYPFHVSLEGPFPRSLLFFAPAAGPARGLGRDLLPQGPDGAAVPFPRGPEKPFRRNGLAAERGLE